MSTFSLSSNYHLRLDNPIENRIFQLKCFEEDVARRNYNLLKQDLKAFLNANKDENSKIRFKKNLSNNKNLAQVAVMKSNLRDVHRVTVYYCYGYPNYINVYSADWVGTLFYHNEINIDGETFEIRVVN